MRSILRLFGACVLAFCLAGTAQAFLITPLTDDRLVVELTATGPDRAGAVAEARRQAVLGSVGRVFLTDQLLMADDLLVKYLGNYNANFVNAVEVLTERFVALPDGSRGIQITCKVFVNYRALVADLHEKAFLYRPATRPRFAAFLTERLDGRIVTDGDARKALSDALTNLGVRRHPRDLDTPPATTDVTLDSFLLDAAVISSQRAGVELILTGEARTTLEDRQSFYFDDFWFYRTEIVGRLVRVDTREVLVEASAQSRAGGKTQAEAVAVSIERASEEVARDLADKLEDFWPTVVQRRSDYEVLLTGSDEELTNIVIQSLRRLGRSSEIHVRKTFDRSAVLSIVFDGPKEELLEIITSTPFPTLNVLNPDAEAIFEVQVTG